MKKHVFLTLFAALLGAGCMSGELKLADPVAVKAYQLQLQESKACTADADCVAVSKGCCECDGQEAVNKKYAGDLSAQREKACGVGPCTLQMCYEDIQVSCENQVCVGKKVDPRAVAL